MTSFLTALLCLGLGALVALAIHLLMLVRTETADARESFCTREEAQIYALKQDEAGFDTFISERHGLWEVRSYRRGRDA